MPYLYNLICCSALAMSFVGFASFIWLSKTDAEDAYLNDPGFARQRKASARRTLYTSILFFMPALVVVVCTDFFGV